MHKKLTGLILAFVLCCPTLLFALPVNAQSTTGGAAVRSDFFSMPASGYFQNPAPQQQTSNLNVGASGLNQLQQSPNTTLVVDSPVVIANNPTTKSSSWILKLLIAIAVLSLIAVIVYIFSVAEQEVDEVEFNEIVAPAIVKKLEILDEAPANPKKAAKKPRKKHGRPAKKRRK